MNGSSTQFEVSTVGLDTSLQGIGSDPNGSPYYVGLRVPAVLPAFNIPKNRYQFLLASASFAAGEVARLVGIRQLLTIGVDVNNPGNIEIGSCQYPVELEVTSPVWHFVDGNVFWSVVRVPPQQPVPNSLNAEGLTFKFGTTPSLMYATTAAQAEGYTPPNGGMPPGTPVIPELAGFHDLRYPWYAPYDRRQLDIEIEGPCTIQMFASIQQTDPVHRCRLILPGQLPGGLDVIPVEDRFLLNFTSAVYWRVAGALVFEVEAPDRSSSEPRQSHNRRCRTSSKREMR